MYCTRHFWTPTRANIHFPTKRTAGQGEQEIIPALLGILLQKLKKKTYVLIARLLPRTYLVVSSVFHRFHSSHNVQMVDSGQTQGTRYGSVWSGVFPASRSVTAPKQQLKQRPQTSSLASGLFPSTLYCLGKRLQGLYESPLTRITNSPIF